MGIDSYIKKLEESEKAEKVFVAFLDVLGFSSFILNNSHEEMMKRYRIIRYLVEVSLTEVAELGVENSPWIKALKKSKDYFDIEPMFDNVKLHSTLIPDFLVVTTQDDTLASLMTLIATIRNIMGKLLYFGFPLRGAISHGLTTINWNVEGKNKNIIHHQMIGASVVKVVAYEKKQNWSGCVLDRSVTDHIGPKVVRMCPDYLVLYDVPMKEYTKTGIVHSTENLYTVSWQFGLSDDAKQKMSQELLISAFAEHGKKVGDSVKEMIDHTHKYYESVLNHPPSDAIWKYLDGLQAKFKNEQCDSID